MKYNAIGIIGGMGPEASVRFYQMLIFHAQKDYHVSRNEDFPEIYLGSFPVPDFIISEDNKGKALDILVNRIHKMDYLQVGMYCMACNTGHLLIGELRKKTQIPFISLLEEVPKVIKEKQIKRIGLLASPTTIDTKMYTKPLKDFGIELITPSNCDKDLLGQIILDTIAGKSKRKNSIKVKEIADRLIKRGAMGILEGCTEIPLIFPKNYHVPVFDTLDILAKAVLNKYYLLQS